jgi:hypothetical protein
VLILAVGVVLALGWVARTDWASARDVFGAGEGFTTAIQPLVKITAALLITVTGVQLLRDGYRRARHRFSAETRKSCSFGREPSRRA